MVEIWHWHTEPALILGILAVSWIYFVSIGPLRPSIDKQAPYPKREAMWFIIAALSFYIAVGSPIDAAGEGFLFSAHMVQHNILMYITPIFILLALPEWYVDGLLDRFPKIYKTLRFLLHPLVAGFLFTFVFSVWHFPGLYEAALHDKVIHMVEHLTMLFVSFLMLWPVMSRSRLIPRLNWGVQILYLFLLMVAQIPLFGILTFAPEVLYQTYELAPRLIAALDPKADQVLGGLIMKIANMVFSLILIGRAFVMWSSHPEEDFAAGRGADAYIGRGV